jgi:hypothetical protein
MTNDDKPVTKQDLIEALGGLEERLREYVHDTETALLRAFHKYADAHHLRTSNLESFQAIATKRLADLEAFDKWASLEVRVLEIEKRLNLNR